MSDYTAKHIKDMEAAFGGGFVKARAELGVTSFGMQVIQMPADYKDYPLHDHAESGQEEVFLALKGSGWIEIEGERVDLEPDVFVRVGPAPKRKVFAGPEGIACSRSAAAPGAAYEINPMTELEGANASAARPGAAIEQRSARTKSRRRARSARRGDQRRGRVHVIELHQLDRRVHVAQRDRHERGGHAAAAEVHRVGVGARVAPDRLHGEGDLLALGRLVQKL